MAMAAGGETPITTIIGCYGSRHGMATFWGQLGRFSDQSAYTTVMEANHVIENLLGRLPGAARGAYQLHALVGEGLPAGVIGRVERTLDLSAAESARVFGLSATSRKRYKSTPRKRLDSSASDRIVRVVSAVAEAAEIFGDESKAIAWFKTPSLALGDERPIDLMTSDPGAKLVRDELLRIRYGHWA